jgi:hypothetical protein
MSVYIEDSLLFYKQPHFVKEGQQIPTFLITFFTMIICEVCVLYLVEVPKSRLWSFQCIPGSSLKSVYISNMWFMFICKFRFI